MSNGIFILYLSIAFLIGIATSFLALFVFNTSFANNLKVKNKLTETELEMTQLKDTLANNLDRTSETIEQIQNQLSLLNEKIFEDKKSLNFGNKEVYKIESKKDNNLRFNVPKDYID